MSVPASIDYIARASDCNNNTLRFGPTAKAMDLHIRRSAMVTGRPQMIGLRIAPPVSLSESCGCFGEQNREATTSESCTRLIFFSFFSACSTEKIFGEG